MDFRDFGTAQPWSPAVSSALAAASATQGMSLVSSRVARRPVGGTGFASACQRRAPKATGKASATQSSLRIVQGYLAWNVLNDRLACGLKASIFRQSRFEGTDQCAAGIMILAVGSTER